jgi:hypothetical protein
MKAMVPVVPIGATASHPSELIIHKHSIVLLDSK